MDKRQSLRLTLLCIVVLILILTPTATAQAWGNGEGNLSSYGSHDWLISQAVRLVGGTDACPWLRPSTALAACDDPDYTWPVVDMHHNFHPDVVPQPVPYPYGDAPTQVELCYVQVKTQIAAGNSYAASRAFGLLAHYFTDVCQPMHTDNAINEGLAHALYEMKVDTLTKSASTNTGWVVLDSLEPVDEDAAYAATVAAATVAHADYTTLVTTYKTKGYNTTVAAITKRCLNAAANGLADILAGLNK